MYKIKERKGTTLAVNTSVEGETIETKVERLLNNEDTMDEGKELIYTRPEDGVIPNFNIRHDHWDDAYEQSSIMAERRTELDAAKLNKRKEILKKKEDEDKYIRDNARKGMETPPSSEGKEV